MTASVTYDPDWKVRAACRGRADEFFPAAEGRSRQAAIEKAVAVCRGGCPVMAECAQLAIVARTTYGVYAGIDLGDTGRVSREKLGILTAIASSKERRR